MCPHKRDLCQRWYRRFLSFGIKFVFCILLPASLLTVRSAELHLSNGDRITGEVVKRENGKIFFRSPVFGEIAVSETDATVVDTPETPVESLAGLPPNAETPKVSEQPARQAPSPGRHVDLPDPKTAPTKWKGKLEFGFINQTGRRDTLNVSIRSDAELKRGVNNYKASARYLYGKSSSIVASNRRDASFRWRHDISTRVFTQCLTSYTSDKIAGIYTNIEQNGSMGYQLVQSDRQKASIGGGLTLQYREANGLESGINYLGELFQDYTYKINGRMTVTQAINALYSPDSRARSITSGTSIAKLNEQADNYKVRFNSSLQGKMSERISLNLRYEYEYDNAIIDPKARTDQRITSSVGYAF